MKWLGISVALMVAAIVIHRIAFPSATARYRLTLEAQADGQTKTGSGAIEVGYIKNPKLLSNEGEFHIDVGGQAVALDLGERGTSFALFNEGGDGRSGSETTILARHTHSRRVT